MRKNGRDLNDRKLNLWRLYAAFAICVLLIVAMTFMPFTPEQFVSIRCPELRVEEVVHVDEIMHNTYAVFFFDYMGFFNCVIVARDGPKQYLLTRAMHLSLITNELSNHITFERFGFEFWIDYGTLWLPDEDEIQSVTIDGMPMELIIVDKYWGFYYACGPDPENMEYLHRSHPKGQIWGYWKDYYVPVT